MHSAASYDSTLERPSSRSIFGLSRPPKTHARTRPSTTGGGSGARGSASQPALASSYAMPAFARDRVTTEDGPSDWLLKLHPLTEQAGKFEL